MDILIFVVALSILVLVHEFGHFIAAIKTGVRVEEFGLGLPPRIFGKKVGKTIFSLNWLLIGGFCRLYGEEGSGKGTEAYNNKNPWQKLLIIMGGVMMNLFLAVVIFTVVYSILGVPQETDKVKIVGVVKGSPAEVAGLKEGMWVQKVGEVTIKKADELTSEVAKYKGGKVSLTLEDKIVEVEVRTSPPVGEGSMGIAISNTEMVKIKWYEFPKGIAAGFKEAYFWGRIIFDGVAKMIGGLLSGQVPKDVSGPIGMFQATTSIKNSQGMLAVIHFFGVISVNLAIMNALPFPALDGGRAVFIFLEIILRRKISQRVETVVNNLGMAVLLSLILLITVGDVIRIIIK